MIEVKMETQRNRCNSHDAQHGRREQGREWILLEDSLFGPAHVAKLLIRKVEERRSTPERLYRLNVDQLECVALFVSALEKRFHETRRCKQALDKG